MNKLALILIFFMSCSLNSENSIKSLAVGFEKNNIQKELDSLNNEVLLEVEKQDSSTIRKFNIHYKKRKLSTKILGAKTNVDSLTIKANQRLRKIYSSSFKNNHDIIKIEIQDQTQKRTYVIDNEGRIHFLSKNNEPKYAYESINAEERLYENYANNKLIQLKYKHDESTDSIAYKLVIQTEDECSSFIISSKRKLDYKKQLEDEDIIIDMNDNNLMIKLIKYEHCDTILDYSSKLHSVKKNTFKIETPLNLLN